MKTKGLLHIYWLAVVITILIWGSVYWKLGSSALLTVSLLTLLETTFSADNAVINSKILNTMSFVWQRIFMTVGVLIAVFLIRFILPIVIVMIGAKLGFHNVLDLALHHPKLYASQLLRDEPAINAFGGTFLLMVALNYFVDYKKSVHWISPLERKLSSLGQFESISTFAMLAIILLLYATVNNAYQTTVLTAAIVAMTVRAGLGLLSSVIEPRTEKAELHKKIGVAAFFAFTYLEILDASFSLDGVIGAFAITSSIVLIVAGLGAGAIWVRAMTTHLVRTNTLARYVFLEHGAYWAIGFLGTIMLLKLYRVNLPEWFVGSLGIVWIIAAVYWSRRKGQKTVRT